MKPYSLLRSRSRGFTMLEVLVAVAIILLMIVSSIGAFNWIYRDQGENKGMAGAGQVEDVIRREITRLMKIYYKAGCPAATPPEFATVLTSGIQLTYLNSGTATYINSLKASDNQKAGATTFNAALDRCATAVDLGASASAAAYYADPANKGIYFCLRLDNATGSNVGTSSDNFLQTMQPVFAELFYTNLDVISNNEVGCPAVAGGAASMGSLYYVLHWTSKSATGNSYRRLIGTTMVGNS